MRISIVAAVVPMLLGAPGVEAAEDRSSTRDAALERVASARRLIAQGSIEATLQAAAGLGDVEAEARSVSPAELPEGVPVPIAAPVARLLGAVDASGRMARAAISVPTHALARARDRSLALLTEAQLGRASDLRNGHRAAQAKLERLHAWTERAVDRPRLHSAGLTLARALDNALTELTTAPGTGLGVDGCDLVDQAPALCIGGLGNNVYLNDYALQIDLGGNDTYRNSAGGADLGVLQGGGGGIAAAVTLDLGGNDRYDATLPVASGARIAQGGAHEGGIGFLVDAAGDDIYRIAATDGLRGAYGQGYATGGVGVLADLGGKDDYGIDDAHLGASDAGGQGVTFIGGVSAALDTGMGDDKRLVEAHGRMTTHANGTLITGNHYAIAYGLASLGAVAISADDGGTDSYVARSTAPTVAPDEPRPNYDGLAVVDAFGLGGVGGATLSVTGVGNTTRIAEAEVRGPNVSGAVEDGFGLSFGPSFGALADAGGDDVYVGRASSRAIRTASIDDSCACAGVQARAKNFVAEATGLGFGWTGGVGIAVDDAGNDRYEWTAEMITEAVARDQREEVLPEPVGEEVDGARAVAEGGTAVQISQGGGNAGHGFFLDGAGNDVYEATLSNRTHAEATSLDPLEPQEAKASDYQNSLVTQGSGYTGGGELRDLGGTDVYRSSATQSVTAEPGEAAPAVLLSLTQAGAGEAGAGILIDLDAGATDTFVQLPAAPACQGTHGGQLWVDCGNAAGLGLNP